MKKAVFFLCTPRSGTVWFGYAFKKSFSRDEVIYAHEYEPFYINSFYRKHNYRDLPECFLDRIKYITDVVENSFYIETGYTSYALLAYYIRLLPCPVQIIHLVRHPYEYLRSMETIDYEHGPWREKAFLTPKNLIDFTNIFKEEEWDTYSDQKKQLLMWTEIHGHYAPWMKKRGNDIFSIKYEDFFKEKDGTALLNKIGLKSDVFNTLFDNKVGESPPNNFTLSGDILEISQLKTIAKEYGYEV